MKQNKIRQTLGDTFELPRDIVLDVPRLTLLGNSQLLVENHRGIILYNEEKIRFNTNIGEFVISGEDLVIKDISQIEMLIEGRVTGITILD